jgi:hypothetical protein
MATKTKIKIIDNTALRAKIDELYEHLNQISLSKWAIKCAQHILEDITIKNNVIAEINNGFATNELWQIGKASVADVRRAAFKIHKLARIIENESQKSALRTAAHAIATAHVKEHAMICSDYAIKTIQLLYPDRLHKVTEERQWQLRELELLISEIKTI